MELRIHRTKDKYPKKMYAMRRAAFDAYKKMYEIGLLDKHLLPLFSSEEEVQKLLKDVEQRINIVKVTPQINPWTPLSETDAWYRSELLLGDLPPLLLYTRRAIPRHWFEEVGPPVLYVPHQGHVRMQLRGCERIAIDADEIREAREYTRRIFWSVHGIRMKWDDIDFSYLFLSRVEDEEWNDRREWLREQDKEKERESTYHSYDADADEFARQFWYPEDVVIVKSRFAYGKCYKFVSWRYDPVNEEELEALRERYSRYDDIEDVPYPLIVAEALPSRTNLLLPFQKPSTAPSPPPRQYLLLPQYSSVTLISPLEAQYVYLLPSVVRALGISLTVCSMRDSLFSQSCLSDIPTSLLATAMTAPLSQEHYNYQRMETLGDTVLKYTVSIQLLAEYPLWHEGYLSRKKDHAVSNARLANENMSRSMYQWIIRGANLPFLGTNTDSRCRSSPWKEMEAGMPTSS